MWKLPEYTWHRERELCKRCEHYRERITTLRYGHQNVVMACNLNLGRTGGKDRGTCIDMRHNGRCGREGKLFKERSN